VNESRLRRQKTGLAHGSHAVDALCGMPARW
jgi:hypothetical protein